MKLSVRPALTTAAVVRGLDTDHDRRRGQRCILLNRPVSLINRGKPVQINRATSEHDAASWLEEIARLLSGSGVALLSYNGLSNSASYLSRRPKEFKRVLERKLFDSDINHELDGFIPGSNYYRASFASDEWWLTMFERYFVVTSIEYSVVNGYQHIAVLRKKVD